MTVRKRAEQLADTRCFSRQQKDRLVSSFPRVSPRHLPSTRCESDEQWPSGPVDHRGSGPVLVHRLTCQGKGSSSSSSTKLFSTGDSTSSCHLSSTIGFYHQADDCVFPLSCSLINRWPASWVPGSSMRERPVRTEFTWLAASVADCAASEHLLHCPITLQRHTRRQPLVGYALPLLHCTYRR